MEKKTHLQLHRELKQAFNDRFIAEKAKDPEAFAAAEAKIIELRRQLPAPKGTKVRWR